MKLTKDKHYFAGTERILANVAGGGQPVVDIGTELPTIKGGNPTILAVRYMEFVGNYFGNIANKTSCVNNGIIYDSKIDIPSLQELFTDAVNAHSPDRLYYFNANHLGSGSLITDEHGQTYQTLIYAPHGEVLFNKFYGDYDEVYKFTGYEKDNESGLNYAKARYQDPNIGFNSTDPHCWNYPWITSYAYSFNNSVMFNDPDGRSGKISINKENKTVTITSKLYFYGSKATTELSSEIARGIASQWNSANAKTTIDGVEYNVKFKIYYETVTEVRAKELASNNTDVKNNFVRVEDVPSGKSSFSLANDNGGNSFWFNTNDELSNSTTASHEFGHGFGLDHPTEDLSTSTDRPNIMIPRNTPYGNKWSKADKNGNRVVNPNSRRVTQENVSNALKTNGGRVNNVIFKEDGTH